MYGLFKKSYEDVTGHSWDQSKFSGRSHNWTFYGKQDEGGIAIRKQNSGLIKLVSAFGSPRAVFYGFLELNKKEGSNPIWGVMSKDLADHLKKINFSSPPPLVIKILAPLVSKAMGQNIKKINNDGAFVVDMGWGDIEKYFVANKPYYKWLLTNDQIPLPQGIKNILASFIK